MRGFCPTGLVDMGIMVERVLSGGGSCPCVVSFGVVSFTITLLLK